MKKHWHAVYSFVALLVMISAVLSGCSQVVPENMDRIKSPSIQDVGFAGTWALSSIPGEITAIAEEYDPVEGETVVFSQDTLLFDGKKYTNVRYKVKRVNVHEYFLHKNAGLPEILSLQDGEIKVTTVYSEDNFLFEFIEDEKGAKIAVIDDSYYSMRKLSDEVDIDHKTAVSQNEQDDPDDTDINDQQLQSGLLLGVRIPVETADGLGDYKYGTYWISCTNGTARQVLYANDIYMPRMDGFWKLAVEKSQGSDGIEDTLKAYKVSNKPGRVTAMNPEDMSASVGTSNRKAIVYVGNDYVCIENTIYSSPGSAAGNTDTAGQAISAGTADAADTSADTDGALRSEDEKTLRTLPVDNLSNIDGIKISDIAGENGKMAMENAISSVLKDSGYRGIMIFDDESQEKNFALYRKTGHWFFKGRIDPDGRGQLPFMDFNLNLLPPSNMVAYDVLHVPWTEMKDKLPHAIDIYTSPNKDIAVVLTRSEILLYTIKNRSLSEQPMARLKLEEGSSVIMAEWGMGDYVTSWEKSFEKNNKTSPVENLLDPVSDTAEAEAEAAPLH